MYFIILYIRIHIVTKRMKKLKEKLVDVHAVYFYWQINLLKKKKKIVLHFKVKKKYTVNVAKQTKSNV